MPALDPDPARRLALPGTTNVRDVGGYPAVDGGVVAHGRLLRGEVVTRRQPDGTIHGTWDPADGPTFRGLGLRTVIDLRSDHEVDTTVSAWTEASGGETVRLPLAQGGEGADTDFVRQLLSGERASFSQDDLTAFYTDTLISRAEVFARVVEIVSDPDRLPALIHCTAGKDRTGLAVALVMELLGCPRDAVVADYALTGVLRPNRVAAYAPMFVDAGVDPEVARPLFETPAASMRDALAHLDVAFGGAARYLEELGGMPRERVERLRGALVDPPSGAPRRLCSDSDHAEGGGGGRDG